MHILTILVLMLPLAACAGGALDLADLVPSPGTTSQGPRFQDSNPHEWESRAPWTYPIHGTDVSKYQGVVNWGALAEAGIAFAFIKATEGGDRLDEYFHRNWYAARAAGIPRGAYHFFYFCRPAIEQARWFIRHVPRERAALPPVLDMEWNHRSPTCRIRPEPQAVRAEMRIFLDAVERHYGKRPIIYTTIDFFDRNGLGEFKDYPFWLRSVAGHPDEKYGDHPWVFWQYTGTGILPGIAGNADINVFRGDAGQWLEWLEANSG